ncbi:ras family protein [Dipodascopsis tothii]|uniref:ras family protein n=1 Tax=Dipodascopsis tothii TaxID=44089 RepID=UPI0034CD7C3B
MSRPDSSVFRVVVLGDGGVGKTALTLQLCLNHFVETYDPTIEDAYRKQVVVDDQACTLEVLDTAGQEEYTALRDQWIRDGEGFVLVYAITSRHSYSRIPLFYSQIQQSRADDGGGAVPLVLIGNKLDCMADREVSQQEGQDMARRLGCEYLEVSAKGNLNIERAFHLVVRAIRQRRFLRAVRANAAPASASTPTLPSTPSTDRQSVVAGSLFSASTSGVIARGSLVQTTSLPEVSTYRPLCKHRGRRRKRDAVCPIL